MILERLETPTHEPISLEEALAHLRLGSDADAAQITALIRAAREQVEARTGQEIVGKYYRLSLPHWLPDTYTELPKGPLQAIEQIGYLPQSHTGPVKSDSYHLLPHGAWRVEPYGPHGQNRLWTVPHQTLPPLYPDHKAVQIEFLSGYAPEAVPGGLRIAILILLRDLYDQNSEPNAALESLTLSHRLSGFAA